MSGRPRSSTDPRAAARGRALGDAELATDAPRFPGRLPGRWRESTRDAFRVYAGSETAKALRSEDVPAVLRLFGYQDELAQRWDALLEGNVSDEGEAIRIIRALESMTTSLATSLGIGPRARQSLGIKTETRPGSRLDAARDAFDAEESA